MCHKPFVRVINAPSNGDIVSSETEARKGAINVDKISEALEQAIMNAKEHLSGLVHHSDHESQYTNITYNDKLAHWEINPSTGSVGDSYDNALAEAINDLYKS
ncbi:DDE-type integrase/transposase/recombinase [Varibaculum massiliense]|uniref:DDE-type integrase/transposase/recombinase n=1 Tax=Varibaculum massiliense TaxID=1852372 RepID=UPI0008DA239B|nr:DDE-type integrase/transposase/recombinase [Varibaculum massiliense]